MVTLYSFLFCRTIFFVFAKADLHIHTICGPDSFTRISQLAHQAVKQGLHVVAVTDHDSLKGGRLMRKYVKAKKLDLDVIVGQEISTLQGHLVGLFLHAKVAPHMTLKEAAQEVKRQGGITIIPHVSFARAVPGSFLYRMRVHYQDLLNDPSTLAYIDAIEVSTYSLFDNDYYPKAHFLNTKLLQKTEVASSDCHISWLVGRAYTLFEGHTAEDLRRAILSRSTAVFPGVPSSLFDRLAHRTASLKIPFAFVLYRVLVLLASTLHISKKFLLYPRFRQQKSPQVVKEIERKAVELEMFDFHHSTRLK